MRIYIPHPFKNHDNYFNVMVFSCIFYSKPWYNKMPDEDWQEEIDLNCFGWLWFVITWYSIKRKDYERE